jgi:integrase
MLRPGPGGFAWPALEANGPAYADGQRLDRHGGGRIVRKIARRAGIGKAVTPDTLRHAFITAALDAGVSLRDVQEAASHADPRTTMRHDRARGSLDVTLDSSSRSPGGTGVPAGSSAP